MSRSDGKYPKYLKIDVDPKVWPEKYWESCRQCSNCDVQWPDHQAFAKSPCCDCTTLRIHKKGPDLNWPNAVKALLQAHFEKFYDEYNEGLSDEELPWADITTNGEVDEEKLQNHLDALINDVTRSKIDDTAK